MDSRRLALLLVSPALLLGACATAAPSSTWLPAPTAATATPRIDAVRVAQVYKSPSCTCCHEWEAYLREAGWEVRSTPTDEMATVKQEHGVPADAWSCHTAIIDGYVVEGHVPLAAIEDLLRTRPDIDGIALPGMPPGSPGMPGEQEQPFEVLALVDGSTSVFGRY